MQHSDRSDAEDSPPPLRMNAAEEKQVVWKAPQHVGPSQAAPPHGGHRDPTSSSRSGASFFGRIRVVIRCRPLQKDVEGDHTDNRVHTHGDEVLVCEKNNPSAGRSYRFDRVLTPDADQASAFAEVAPLVDHVLDGFHATVFAYGQTGSGKTFTMDGLRYVASSRTKGVTAMVPDPEGTPVEQHGIMPRIIQLLFDHARARQGAAGETDDEGASDGHDGVEYTFRCSYYQIYNEKITDLLRTTGASPDPQGGGDATTTTHEDTGRRNGAAAVKRRFDDAGLRVRWHKGDVFKVENLFICTCTSPDEMREMLFSGIQQKVVSSHMMNHQSSRSHCVFTIYVECRSRKNGELRSRSELSLVDLAGSEKIGLLSSNPSAKLVKESIDINTSLLALGKVIMALSSHSHSSNAAAAKTRRRGGGAMGGRTRGPAYGGGGHIPYRDSKLTMLLKHALGGNSLTTMIACISPSDRYVEETTSTLLYAGRAKNIRNAPHVNEDATTTLIRQLREEVAQLKAELNCYREMAARSLGDPDVTQGRLCARCGGDVPPPVRTEANGESRALTSSPSTETAVAAREAEQLADSLIAACDMLKNMMQVNAELRESYDAVRDAQDGSERREADLNAENLALRERLSVLESIVLQDDQNDTEKDEAEEGGEGSLDSTTTREALETAEAAAKAAAALRASGGGYRGDGGGAPSPSPPPSERTAGQSPRSTARPPISLDPPPRPAVEAVRAIPVGPSTSREELPHVVKSLPRTAPAATSSARAAAKRQPQEGGATSSSSPPAPTKVHGSLNSQGPRKKKSQKKKRKHHVLARRLKEYEQHYRAPSKTQSYEDYYEPLRNGRPPVVPRVLPIRASAPEAAQTTAALEDMRVTVAKMPKSVVPDFVPVSLLAPGLFGSLAFGGQQEERAGFEQQRSDRAARLRALQQRQQELYQQVHRAVRDISNYPTVVSSLSSQQQEGDEGQARMSQTVLQEEAAVSIGGSQSQRRGSSGELGTRRSSAENFAPYSSASTRLRTAAYQEAKGSRSSGARRSTDSMTRLMEYLDKGTS